LKILPPRDYFLILGRLLGVDPGLLKQANEEIRSLTPDSRLDALLSGLLQV